MELEKNEFLSVADFLMILFRRRVAFIVALALVLAVTVAYLALAKKTYRLTGAVYVGRFQGVLLEEGEFVAKKLQDYSFIKNALDRAGVVPDIPIARVQKLVDTEVVNEVKKISDVGIVKLTVDYKDREMAYKIFKALTDHLKADHGELLDNSRAIFQKMEDAFWEKEKFIDASIEEDQAFAKDVLAGRELDMSVPSHLLLQHTISEKADFLKTLLKEIYYIRIETSAATRSFNSKLAAEPAVPDEHYKPKTILALALGGIMGLVLATLAALSLHFYDEKIKGRINERPSS